MPTAPLCAFLGELVVVGRRHDADPIADFRQALQGGTHGGDGQAPTGPPRGIAEKTILALQSAAFQAGISPGEVLLDLGRKGEDSPYWSIMGRSASLLADFGALLSDWHSLRDQVTLVTLFDRIISDTGYEPYINDQSEEGNDRWDNVQELRRLAYDYDEKGLTEFLQNLALVSDQDTIPPEGDQQPVAPQKAVTLLTLHAAKGLEFNQVFIMGLDEGLLPHSRSRDDPEEMAEERRLFYVGMTRARNQLYLLRSERRSSFGTWETSEPSRFLEDISEELVTNQGRRHSNRRDARLDDMRWTTTGVSAGFGRTRPHAVPEQSESRYRPGMHIRSASWGEGIILESKIDPDGEETVDVHFATVGFKRLLASLANLEIIQ